LVWLCAVSVALKIDLFFHAWFSKQVMAAFDSFLKPKALQQAAEVVKSNRRIGRPAQNSLERFARAHANILPIQRDSVTALSQVLAGGGNGERHGRVEQAEYDRGSKRGRRLAVGWRWRTAFHAHAACPYW
jgi:hypothetical protein